MNLTQQVEFDPSSFQNPDKNNILATEHDLSIVTMEL